MLKTAIPIAPIRGGALNRKITLRNGRPCNSIGYTAAKEGIGALLSASARRAAVEVPISPPVEITIETPRKYDLDAFCKIVLDAATAAGVIADDSQKIVRSITLRGHHDPAHLAVTFSGGGGRS